MTETEVTQAVELLLCPFCGSKCMIAATLDDQYRPMCRTDGCAALDGYNKRADAIEAWNTRTQSAAQNVPVLLEAHFKRMQEACANYVEPTTYIARHPVGELCKWNTEFPEPSKHQSIDAALAATRRRDQAFINDMIYMLDGPEQRAAIAQAQEPE